MNLSEHFTFEEFTHSQTASRLGLPNEPPPETLEILTETAARMEEVRLLLGHPVLVSSGYRSPEVNAAVGSLRSSAHVKGYAVDFTCPGFGDPLAVCRAIFASSIRYDQLIYEFGPTGWVHISFDPIGRQQNLTATRTSRGTQYAHGLG